MPYMMHLVAIADREVQRILLELLNQMDGFDQNVNVKVTVVSLLSMCRSHRKSIQALK